MIPEASVSIEGWSEFQEELASRILHSAVPVPRVMITALDACLGKSLNRMWPSGLGIALHLRAALPRFCMIQLTHGLC